MSIDSSISKAYLKHILTSAECVVANKDEVRTRYENTGPVEGVIWCSACNLFVLAAYDIVSNAVTNNAKLLRAKTFTHHEKAFRHGYKYNIGINQYP